jgi:hypothetical protein
VRVLFVIGRVVFGSFFLASGFFDLRHYRFFVPLVAASGVPFPRFAVIFALVLILVGGISIVLGLWPRAGLCLIPATPAGMEGWNEERFFAKARGVDQPLGQFAEDLRQLSREHPDDLSLAFGRGATPSVTLLKGGRGILTFQIEGSGSLTFNPPAFPLALGQAQGSYYLEKLQALFPHGIKEKWAYVKLNQRTAERELGAVLDLVRDVLSKTAGAGIGLAEATPA